MNQTLHTPFSRPIMVQKLPSHKEFKKVIVPEIIKKYENRTNDKAGWSKYCNTWATKAMGLDLIETELKSCINSWFSFFSYPYINYSLDAWYNVHTWNMHQNIHTHMSASNILSGIYYIQLHPFDYTVTFLDMNNRYMEMARGIDLAPKNPMLSEEFEPDLEEGDLVLFRPDTYHLVLPADKKHDEYRISLAFNVVA